VTLVPGVKFVRFVGEVETVPPIPASAVSVKNASHFAQYSLLPVLPNGIVVTAVPVNAALSNHPLKVKPVRVGF